MREVLVKLPGYHQLKNGIAEKLETFVVVSDRILRTDRAVCQGKTKKRGLIELVAKSGFDAHSDAIMEAT